MGDFAGGALGPDNLAGLSGLTDLSDLTDLTDLQRHVRDDVLGLGTTERPEWPAGWGEDWRADLDTRLQACGAGLEPGAFVPLDKYAIASLGRCEGEWLARRGGSRFAWNARNLRGRILHAAVELLVASSWGMPPLRAARGAMDVVTERDESAGEYLAGLDEGRRAALVANVNEVVAKLAHDFPPLLDSWHPRTESRMRFRAGPFRLAGVPDLVLGRPRGTQARTVVVDFKTGDPSDWHRQDLGFYAVLETVRSRVPPRRCVTYYVDHGEGDVLDVDESALAAAAERVLCAARTAAALVAGAEPPRLAPGGQCRWCSGLESCPPGRAQVGDDVAPPGIDPVTGADVDADEG